MRAAPSVLIFTVTAGLGQGLYVSLVLSEFLAAGSGQALVSGTDLAIGGALSLVLLGIGLLASFFHLGHPMRAWRAMSMWRTSWLSREVIVLPLTMALVFAWSVAHWFELPGTIVLGLAGLVLTGLLWYCTAMIYACLRFLQEWSHPLTVVNFVLIGLASGFTLSAWYWSIMQPDFKIWTPIAALSIVIAAVTRIMSLRRNAGLKAKSTLQTALGINTPKIAQKAQGASAGSFNTREYFHGKSMLFVVRARATMLTMGFAIPALLCALAWALDVPGLLALAVAVQYVGLLAERWVFFAQAKHPQNLYYQVVS